jgi:transcription elongation factor GreB
MSRAFTKEVDDAPEQNLPGLAGAELPAGVKNYMTPHGFRRFSGELQYLAGTRRPEVARLLAQATATSDPLEEQTQKRALRQIEARMQFLRQRIEQAEVVDPLKRTAAQNKIFFGATVLYRNRKGEEKRVCIVGVDETDIASGYISFLSPLAKALLRASEGDTVPLQTPSGADELEILEVAYREIEIAAFAPTV